MNNLPFDPNFYSGIYGSLQNCLMQWGNSGVYPKKVCNDITNSLHPNNYNNVSAQTNQLMTNFYNSVCRSLQSSMGATTSYPAEVVYRVVSEWADRNARSVTNGEGWFRDNNGWQQRNNSFQFANNDYTVAGGAANNMMRAVNNGVGYMNNNGIPAPGNFSSSGIPAPQGYSNNAPMMNTNSVNHDNNASSGSSSWFSGTDVGVPNDTPTHSAPVNNTPVQPLSSIHSSDFTTRPIHHGNNGSSTEYTRPMAPAERVNNNVNMAPPVNTPVAPKAAPVAPKTKTENYSFSSVYVDDPKFVSMERRAEDLGFNLENIMTGTGDQGGSLNVYDLDLEVVVGDERSVIEYVRPLFACESSYFARIRYNNVEALQLSPTGYRRICKFFHDQLDKVINTNSPCFVVDRAIYRIFVGDDARRMEQLLVDDINNRLKALCYDSIDFDLPLGIDYIKDFDELLNHKEYPTRLGSNASKWKETFRAVLRSVLRKFFVDSDPIYDISAERLSDLVHCKVHAVYAGLSLQDALLCGDDDDYTSYFTRFFKRYVVIHTSNVATYTDVLETIDLDTKFIPQSERNDYAVTAAMHSVMASDQDRNIQSINLHRVINNEVIPLYIQCEDKVVGYRITWPIIPGPSIVFVKDGEYDAALGKLKPDDAIDELFTFDEDEPTIVKDDVGDEEVEVVMETPPMVTRASSDDDIIEALNNAASASVHHVQTPTGHFSGNIPHPTTAEYLPTENDLDEFDQAISDSDISETPEYDKVRYTDENGVERELPADMFPNSTNGDALLNNNNNR